MAFSFSSSPMNGWASNGPDSTASGVDLVNGFLTLVTAAFLTYERRGAAAAVAVAGGQQPKVCRDWLFKSRGYWTGGEQPALIQSKKCKPWPVVQNVLLVHKYQRPQKNPANVTRMASIRLENRWHCSSMIRPSIGSSGGAGAPLKSTYIFRTHLPELVYDIFFSTRDQCSSFRNEFSTHLLNSAVVELWRLWR